MSTDVNDELTKQLSFFQKMALDIKADMLSFSIKVLLALVVFIIGVIIIHFIKKAVHKSLTRASSRFTVSNVHFIEQLVKIILYIILFFIIFDFFGVSATSVVALLGTTGFSIGLAFQGALSNFAGGVLLMIYKPFSVGDYIIISSPACEGRVTYTGVIYTQLEFAPFKKISVPNGVLANTTINNMTQNGARLLQIDVGISYSSNIKVAKSILEELAQKSDKIIHDRPVNIYVTSFNDSSITVSLLAFVPDREYFSIKCSLLEQIKQKYDENNIEIAFNQLDVHIVNDK